MMGVMECENDGTATCCHPERSEGSCLYCRAQRRILSTEGRRKDFSLALEMTDGGGEGGNNGE